MTNQNWQFETEQSLVENHGLKIDEFERIVEGLGREPNLTELGIFSAIEILAIALKIFNQQDLSTILGVLGDDRHFFHCIWSSGRWIAKTAVGTTVFRCSEFIFDGFSTGFEIKMVHSENVCCHDP